MLSAKLFGGIGIIVIALSGCANSNRKVTLSIAGGDHIEQQKNGSGFKEAENDRAVVTEAGLQAVIFEGKYYLRWTFGVRPKQPTELSSIRIEDVSDLTPVLLINDVAPQQDAGKWSATAGLMELSPTSVPWFYQNSETVRILRVTVREVTGQNYTLFQAVLYTPEAKSSIRKSVGQ